MYILDTSFSQRCQWIGTLYITSVFSAILYSCPIQVSTHLGVYLSPVTRLFARNWCPCTATWVIKKRCICWNTLFCQRDDPIRPSLWVRRDIIIVARLSKRVKEYKQERETNCSNAFNPQKWTKCAEFRVVFWGNWESIRRGGGDVDPPIGHFKYQH